MSCSFGGGEGGPIGWILYMPQVVVLTTLQRVRGVLWVRVLWEVVAELWSICYIWSVSISYSEPSSANIGIDMPTILTEPKALAMEAWIKYKSLVITAWPSSTSVDGFLVDSSHTRLSLIPRLRESLPQSTECLSFSSTHPTHISSTERENCKATGMITTMGSISFYHTGTWQQDPFVKMNMKLQWYYLLTEEYAMKGGKFREVLQPGTYTI